ncbi:MAG: 4-hydroxyproline epimerase [Granulosicoccus sp.]|jgi:4-hydroxyproline epimerase
MSRSVFKCIDGHTCGNPVRLIVEGKPELQGSSMMEKRLHFMKEFDWIRTGLMFEPRGNDMMSGGFIYPPENPENDLGIIYIETSGCLPMCGHGTIGMITIAIEEGHLIPKTSGKVRLETPAGLVLVEYTQNGLKVESVKLTNVASFLHSEGLSVHSDELGELTVDVAYGGNFYVIIDQQKNFSGIQDFTASQLVSMSQQVRQSMNDQYEFIHPENADICGIKHLLWAGDTMSPNATARNAVFYGEKAIDRSPCGTGTSARMAQWAAKGRLKVGDEFVHESFIGSQFVGRVEAETNVGEYPAIVPSIEGWAKLTGYNTIIIDDEDPYAHGFQVI